MSEKIYYIPASFNVPSIHVNRIIKTYGNCMHFDTLGKAHKYYTKLAHPKNTHIFSIATCSDTFLTDGNLFTWGKLIFTLRWYKQRYRGKQDIRGVFNEPAIVTEIPKRVLRPYLKSPEY